MKIKRSKYAVMGILLAVGLQGCHGGKENKTQESESVGIPTVTVAEPVVDSVTLHREFPGFLTAASAIDVPARASGLVTGCYYSNGDYVKKGQVLFTIESTRYDQAIIQAQASLDNALSNVEYYTKRLAAMEKAYAAQAVSEMDVVASKNNLNSARADVMSARAQLKDAQTSRGYCTVRAPISGYASANLADVGEFVGGDGGGVTLCTIYDNTSMTANFSIEEGQYMELLGGNGVPKGEMYRKVPLALDQHLAHSYTADLNYTSVNVDPSTGTVKVEGKVMNPYNELKDGMYVAIRLPYGTDPHAILVEDASIGTGQRGKYLYVLGAGNKVEYRPIQVSESYGDGMRIVVSGIEPGEKYLTDAQMSVRPGMKVKPVMKK